MGGGGGCSWFNKETITTVCTKVICVGFGKLSVTARNAEYLVMI